MPIKTPKFWYRNNNDAIATPVIEQILSPFSKIYQLAHKVNVSIKTTKHSPIPVICIGNITAGGSGKTPTIIALKKIIINNELFKSPFFLSRGYGGKQKFPYLIAGHENADEVGDEPLLLAKHCNTIISRNRYNGAVLANKMGADCILMDDGFQNTSLHKDLSIIVIDGKSGLGNRKTLPSGPLREPHEEAFKRCDAIIIIGKDQTKIHDLIPPHIPIFTAKIKPYNLDKFDLSQKYFAFAGLGIPQKFYDTLKDNNFKLMGFQDFSDHHKYSENDIKTLIDKAHKNKAQLITTEKDYMRIPENFRKYINFLPITLIFDDNDKIIDLLNNKLIDNKSK